jgi:predicted CXXCH cytochrome family protein
MATTSPGPREVTSNVARSDYAGSAACADCHPDEYAAWARSAMHNMTRNIDGAEVHAPFAGERFVFKSDDAVMETKDGRRFVTIHAAGHPSQIFEVTRVIGGRRREDFAGVEVDGVGSAAHAIDDGRYAAGEERVLPVSYVIGERAYRYKGYSVMTPERPGLRAGATWRRTCIFCHNTEPYLEVMLGALAPGSPPYQGEVVDALLPPARRRDFVVSDTAALTTALDTELHAIGGRTHGGDVRALATDAMRQIRGRWQGKDLLEVGIGCESCHGGSREHVQHSARLPSYLPHAPYLATTPVVADAAAARAQAINRTCARCHQVLFTGYPFTWEGGLRKDESRGGSHINSGEGRDFLLGACASKLACTACHDPHARDPAALAKLDGPAGNAICVGCHAKYATPGAVAEHSHHDPNGAGASCMGCHMPRKNMSLDMRLGRYHRIGSPDDPQRVEHDRPLECALCHADKRVGELLATMEKWWGKHYDAAAIDALYGTPSANVMRATLARGKAHEQAVALYTLGEAKARDAAPLVAAQLTHPYPILRYYARDALTKMIDAPPAGFDLHADDGAITSAAARWLARAGMKPIVVRVSATAAHTDDED